MMIVMRTAIMAMVFAVVLTACGAGGFTRVDAPEAYPFKQYAITEFGRAETDVRAGLVILTVDKYDPYRVMNFDVTIMGYDADGFIILQERHWGQIKSPNASRNAKYPVPAGLVRLAITNFEAGGML